jgi:hypothetical protein
MKKSQQRALGGDDVSTLILTKNKRQSYKIEHMIYLLINMI